MARSDGREGALPRGHATPRAREPPYLSFADPHPSPLRRLPTRCAVTRVESVGVAYVTFNVMTKDMGVFGALPRSCQRKTSLSPGCARGRVCTRAHAPTPRRRFVRRLLGGSGPRGGQRRARRVPHAVRERASDVRRRSKRLSGACRYRGSGQSGPWSFWCILLKDRRGRTAGQTGLTVIQRCGAGGRAAAARAGASRRATEEPRQEAFFSAAKMMSAACRDQPAA